MTKILVIEDETVLRGEMMRWLTFEGYEVTGAEDGIAGVERAIRELPDLIISDITMPRLDGYGVLLEMRANPASAHIPFIFVTARASREDLRQGMALGADDYITKPFSNPELLQAVQARLKKKNAQQSHYELQLEQFQKALLQENEKRLLKAKLIAMFSHDLDNQISVVLSSITLLRTYADRLDEKRRLEKLIAIEAAAYRLQQMREDMLLIAEMETGHLAVEMSPLDVGHYLQGIIEEFQIIAGGRHHFHFDSRFNTTVMTDARLLRQIAANLISNAIKYSPQGGEVRVLLDHRNGQYSVSVQDYGIGISQSDQGRIFNAFQRGTNVKSISGTGLGLAIVKQAVDLQGGTIQLESQVGSGTLVVVTIPYDLPESED